MTPRRMIAELEILMLHARRAKRALQKTPIDQVDARTELRFILDAMPQLRAIDDELAALPPPQPPPAA